MRVNSFEIEFASDEKYHSAQGGDSGVITRLAFGGLEQAIESFEEAIGLPGLCPSHDAAEVAANHFRHSFIGSTLDRMTLVHHCASKVETTWIFLRSRISRSCLRYSQAPAVRLVVI